jgi:tetracycline 7-halogenase / FADH2 O2-dependent halogenase
MSAPITTRVEVIVLGSGIGGSTVAAILARAGVGVAVVDRAKHPRFALGESTIGETSILLRQMAVRYDVPELAHCATSIGIREHVSARCGIKRNFGFVYQRPDLEHDPFEVTQCNVNEGPFGPESHLMRADVDAYLFRAAVRYGALDREGVGIADVRIDEDGARVALDTGEVLEGEYVIDATGRGSVLAAMYDLREEPCRFETQSRTLFTHMRGVRPYDEVAAPSGQPSPWHEGTLHQLFDGGWLWVIPFDNHDASESDVVSVGLNLDLRKHPRREGVTPEQEWAEYLERFPSVARQFEDAELVFPWVSTGRTQFSSSRTVGDRWCLMSHAAGAIDALFSRGMANTMAVIEAFVPTYLAAREEGDLSAERFAYVDRLSQQILDNNDKLIAGSYVAFGDFDLWRAWSKLWFLVWNLGVIRVNGAFYRFVETGDAAELAALHEGELPGTFCPELASVQEQFERCWRVIRAVRDGAMETVDAVAELAFILGDHEASPAPLNLHDVLRRWHDGSVETQELIYAWGRTAAPAALRRYFAYDRATVRLAAERTLHAPASAA